MSLFLLCGLLSFAVPVSGQQDALTEGQGAPRAAAEVSSVKPSQSGVNLSIAPTLNGYSAKGISARVLICGAYAVGMCDRVSGLPGWGDSARFDIEQKFDEGTVLALQKLPEREQFERRRAMLRALLADRFGLKVHHEARESLVYSLVVAKIGAKLVPSPPNEAEGMMVGASKIVATATTMDDLVGSLSDMVGRMVIDSTRLKGKYDFRLTASTNFDEAVPGSEPSIFAALQEQLGLKLMPTKAPVDTIVIDHIEKPAAN